MLNLYYNIQYYFLFEFNILLQCNDFSIKRHFQKKQYNKLIKTFYFKYKSEKSLK